MADRNEQKAAYKAAKKAYKKAKRRKVSGWKFLGIFTSVISLILVGVTAFLNVFDNTVAAFVGGSFTKLINPDENAEYFKSDFATAEEQVKAGKQVCYEVEAEGAALLKNNGVLPLAANSKVSTLSSSSVDLVYGGTGSGNVDASKAKNLKDCLESSLGKGCVNPVLWDFYRNGAGKSYRRSAGEGESAVLAGHASINEVPEREYMQSPGVIESFSEYGDAAIITLSRVGGEGYDCNFHGITDENTKNRNYLALSAEEKEMFSMAEKYFEKIVVLLNTSNPLQLDFLKDYDVDAVLWVGGLGSMGTEAVADILAGAKTPSGEYANPSGSLVDTYLYDNYSAPAMQNFTALTYQGDVSAIPANATTYMVYQEGIYVGYKYFETRYEDKVMGRANVGDFNYAEEVAYPFGYGLSYSTFEYSDFKIKDNGTTVAIDLKITNTSDRDGKETVQIYSQSPYTAENIKNGVEKASVNLVGFEKVFVPAGETVDVPTITVDKRDIASYDAYGAGTYILDAGTYYLTAATDAHNAINNILTAKGYDTDDGMDEEGNADLVGTWEQATIDAETFSCSLNGTKIVNQLGDADPNLYFGAGTVQFLTRSDWTGSFPTPDAGKYYKDYHLTLNDRMIAELQEGRYKNMPEYYEGAISYHEENSVFNGNWREMPALNQKNGTKLYDVIQFSADGSYVGTLAYEDPVWKDLLANLTKEELVSIGDCFHWRMPVVSVHAPGTRDENGPQGLTASLIGSDASQMDATAFTSEDVMAATFNRELIEKVGNLIGNDCLRAGVTCLYGPGANTHRTPYGGRNFEYYSEDGFLAGEMGGAEVSGIQKKGVDVVMKHFALNDCEQDRLGQAAWINEQAARELYLKAFQKSLEESGGNGVMTAYTRWGTTWSGANFNLMTNVMRREWGNKGMSITDNILVTYTNAVDAILAGGVTCFDAMLWYATSALEGSVKDPVVVNAMVEAMHHNLYALANSSGINRLGKDTTVKKAHLIVIDVCMIASVVLGAVAVLSIIFWVRGNYKIKEQKIAMKEAKKAYKRAKSA